jgi:hypothetical protein
MKHLSTHSKYFLRLQPPLFKKERIEKEKAADVLKCCN